MRPRARVSVPVVLVVLASIAGCGGERRTAGSSAAISGWTTGETEDTRPTSRTIDGREAPPPATESRTIGGASSPHGRGVTRRGSLVDVELSGAPLREAMRLLAEVAGVDVVIAEGVEGTVDVELHDVRALDAMTLIAQAHGATLELQGRVAIVRP